MYKKILVAVDGSENSLRATKQAATIAFLAENCSVEILSVADYSKTKSEVLYSESLEKLNLERKKRLKPAEDILQKQGVEYTVKILHGIPGPTIVSYANKNNFDMLVIGSRGLNTLQEMVLGSVSHKVAKRADCPVLIVK
ncbi:universal stress protein [Pueribacillus sp. YX66]|uniref:universal stress protein n=1 Tax=Pueribacillus sp. YX66 TaxID=3229242 RepID=UPI00358CEFD5